MNATFKDLTWEKGTISFWKGEGNFYLPHGSIKASNGKYIVPNSARLNLSLLTEDGRTITVDIANVVKNINGWGKISEKRFKNLKVRLEKQNFVVDENDEIVDLGGIVLF